MRFSASHALCLELRGQDFKFPAAFFNRIISEVSTKRNIARAFPVISTVCSLHPFAKLIAGVQNYYLHLLLSGLPLYSKVFESMCLVNVNCPVTHRSHI